MDVVGVEETDLAIYDEELGVEGPKERSMVVDDLHVEVRDLVGIRKVDS